MLIFNVLLKERFYYFSLKLFFVKKLTIIFLYIISFYSFSQEAILNNNYPINYFSNPLEIPLILSGTFGELRPNHFHAGLDIKTQQKEGLNVLAAANGYVSRIKISLWGYGKALYVTHPNGYTTVYAHLQKFNDQIEAFIKKQQYLKESFEIQVFPAANELPVTQNEVIAYSGSTGGFVGPHLHFEIRDTKTEKPINPFLFGIIVPDTKKPIINTLIGYSLDNKSAINKSNEPVQLSFKQLNNGDYLANSIEAIGKISFGVNSFDQLNGAANKNGLYSLELFLNEKPIHEFKAVSFSFYEGKYINLLIDYERYATLKQRIQKCYTEPSNKLDMYPIEINNGYITVENGLDYTATIIAKDFAGNTQKLIIPIKGKNEENIIFKPITTTAYKINHTDFQKFSQENVTVAFPKNTFYNDFYLDFEVSNGIAKIHEPIVPLNNNYTLTFDVSNYNSDEKKYMYIASINEKGEKEYENTIKKETTFYTSTKKLGKFTLEKDTIPPKIQLINFKDEQWVTNFNTLKIRITDNESDINTYKGEIDGEWILLEYNVKNGILTYNLNDKKFSEAKHHLKITVTDNVGNSETINTTFYRKK